MKTIKLWGVFVALMCFAVVGPLAAQETTVAESEPAEATAEQPEIVLPGSWRLNGLRYEGQHWNNLAKVPQTLSTLLDGPPACFFAEDEEDEGVGSPLSSCGNLPWRRSSEEEI